MQVAYQIPARTQVRSWAGVVALGGPAFVLHHQSAVVALGGPALVPHRMLDTTADLPPPSRAYHMQVQTEVGEGKNT